MITNFFDQTATRIRTESACNALAEGTRRNLEYLSDDSLRGLLEALRAGIGVAAFTAGVSVECFTRVLATTAVARELLRRQECAELEG